MTAVVPSGDARALRTAGRRAALQASALVAVVLLLVITSLVAVVLRQQEQATDDLLRGTAAGADDVGDPPPGAWIVLVRSTSQGPRTESTPGLPDDLARRLQDLREASTTTGPRTVALDGHRYRVLQRSGALSQDDGDGDGDAGPDGAGPQDGVVQVALDLEPQEEQRERLLRVTALAAAAGLLLSAGAGAVIGRRAVRPLAASLALQRRFVADASHELRTPLTLLSTRAQMLSRSLDRSLGADDPRRRDAVSLTDDIGVLSEVVDDLLIAADPMRAQARERVDLTALVGQVVASAQPYAEGRSVQVALSAPEVPLVVDGTRAALRRAVLALVDNAVEHVPPGGRVDLGLSRRGALAVLRVSDTGPGIAPQDRERVMERFASGGQRAGRRHYGLGLALTHDVVERHGGALRLLASDGGAVFEVELPLVRG